jgi:predicted amidohydrolase YtcJ
VGSIEVGKDADLVIWDKHPLSTYARAEKVFIDGTLFFDSSLPGYGLTMWKDAPMTGGNGFGSDDEEGR